MRECGYTGRLYADSQGTSARDDFVECVRAHRYAVSKLSGMTTCVEPLRHLATSNTKSSKRSVLIGRAGTKSD